MKNNEKTEGVNDFKKFTPKQQREFFENFGAFQRLNLQPLQEVIRGNGVRYYEKAMYEILIDFALRSLETNGLQGHAELLNAGFEIANAIGNTTIEEKE